MKYLGQLSIIMAVTLSGEILSNLIPAAVPASVYGMIIMFALLQSGILKVEMVRETGKFLIGIMGIMFVPAVSGVVLLADTLLSSIPLYFAVVASTAVVMAAAGSVTQLVLRRKGKT